MNKVLTDPKHYNEIAKAIRAKGVEGSWTPAEMPAAIASIQGGGGSSGDDTQMLTNEEMYRILRPKEWPEMPSAKQYLLDNPDVWFCGYYFLSKPSMIKFFFRAIGVATITVFGWNGSEWVQDTEYTNTKSGNTSTNGTEIKAVGSDYIYELIRITSTDTKYTHPFYIGTSFVNSVGNLSDIDICGRGTNTADTTPYNMFGATPFLNVETLAPQEDIYYRTPLFVFTNPLTISNLRVVRNFDAGTTQSSLFSSSATDTLLYPPAEPYYTATMGTSYSVQNGGNAVRRVISITQLSNTNISIGGSYNNNSNGKLTQYLVGTESCPNFFSYLQDNRSIYSAWVRNLDIKYIKRDSTYPDKCYTTSTAYFTNYTYCSVALLKATLDFVLNQVDYDLCKSHLIRISTFIGPWDDEVKALVQKATDNGWTITVSTGGEVQ